MSAIIEFQHDFFIDGYTTKLKPNAELPPELDVLKQKQQWVVSHFFPPADKEKKKRKVPFNPVTGKTASTNDSNTWGSYAQAKTAYAGNGFYDCMGYEVGSVPDGLIWFDFDGCVEQIADGVYAVNDPEIDGIIKRLNSYTELSISKKGCHVLVKGQLPQNCNTVIRLESGKNMEVYDRDRYFCMTGYKADGCSGIVENRQAINLLCGIYEFSKKKRMPVVRSLYRTTDTQELILQKARASGSGAKFKKLFDNGDWSDYPSQSEADVGLCLMLLTVILQKVLLS